MEVCPVSDLKVYDEKQSNLKSDKEKNNNIRLDLDFRACGWAQPITQYRVWVIIRCFFTKDHITSNYFLFDFELAF